MKGQKPEKVSLTGDLRTKDPRKEEVLPLACEGPETSRQKGTHVKTLGWWHSRLQKGQGGLYGWSRVSGGDKEQVR